MFYVSDTAVPTVMCKLAHKENLISTTRTSSQLLLTRTDEHEKES